MNARTAPERALGRLLTLASFAISVVSLAAGSLAAGEIEYHFKDRVIVGQGVPSVTLVPDAQVTRLTLTFTPAQGKAITKRYKTIQAGDERRIALPKGRGVRSWTVTSSGDFADGSTISQRFEIKTAVLAPLEIQIEKKNVDMDRGRLGFSLTRAATTGQLTTYDKQGELLGTVDHRLGAGVKNQHVDFDPNDGDVGRVVLRVTDDWDFWAEVEIRPFTVSIPHEDVVFDFGKSEFQASEVPKLEDTLEQISKAMKKFGSDLVVSLYVAGYTDTVGTKEANLLLSQQRAMAIASWFRTAGLSIPIYYQGFGESVLFKTTPDATPEALNRRAVYILGSRSPEKSSAIPRQNWKLVR